MKKFFILILLMSTRTYAAQFSELSFLQGCWQTSTDYGTLSEIWLQPSQNLMMGMAQTKDLTGVTTDDEYLRIRRLESGDIILSPFRNGIQVVDFTFSTSESEQNTTFEKIVFVNELHDFPQRIIYFKDRFTPGMITITLKGQDPASKELVIEYSLNKIDCNLL